MPIIECPNCQHSKVLVSVWGTGILSIKDGEEFLSVVNVDSDNKDYYECPECEYKGIRFDFIKEKK